MILKPSKPIIRVFLKCWTSVFGTSKREGGRLKVKTSSRNTFQLFGFLSVGKAETFHLYMLITFLLLIYRCLKG